MKTEQLRKSILQMAIQGKLVPQDPTDEPASALLDRIRAEKQRLIKEGKIKKDKLDSVIFRGDDNRYYEKIGNEVKDITEEIDFDLPNGWEYVRLYSIGELGSGFTPKPHELANCGEIPYFKVADMNNVGNEKYLISTQNYLVNRPKKIFPKNSIAFPKNGGAVFTNKKRILVVDSVVDLNTGVFSPCKSIDFNYAFLLFSTIDFRKHYKGTALPTVNNEFMNSMLFGLPPLSEQKRIVKEIEKYEPLISEYDKLEQEKSKLDGEIYDRLKKSILQYAIQGKLVPQDSSDEPASVLLERIRAEKKAKLGKKYVDSYIYKGDDNCYYEKIGTEVKNITEEIPFEIPENWVWIRLKQIIDFSKGNSISPEQISDSAWILDLEDIERDSGQVIRKKRMKELKAKSDKHKFYQGNVLYSKLRPYLNKVIIADEDGFCTSEILVFDFTPIHSEYAQLYLMSPFFVEYAMSGAYGVKMPRLGSERGNDALMPIPPLKEQERIIRQIHRFINKLKDEA